MDGVDGSASAWKHGSSCPTTVRVIAQSSPDGGSDVYGNIWPGFFPPCSALASVTSDWTVTTCGSERDPSHTDRIDLHTVREFLFTFYFVLQNENSSWSRSFGSMWGGKYDFSQLHVWLHLFGIIFLLTKYI